MTALAIILLAVVSVGFTLWPLLNGGGRQTSRRHQSLVVRLNERTDAALDHMAELDFEHSMGRLATADHGQMRGGLEASAAKLLAQLETIEEARAHHAPVGASNFCAMCGTGLPSKARFCPSCGEGITS